MMWRGRYRVTLRGFLPFVGRANDASNPSVSNQTIVAVTPSYGASPLTMLAVFVSMIHWGLMLAVGSVTTGVRPAAPCGRRRQYRHQACADPLLDLCAIGVGDWIGMRDNVVVRRAGADVTCRDDQSGTGGLGGHVGFLAERRA